MDAHIYVYKYVSTEDSILGNSSEYLEEMFWWGYSNEHSQNMVQHKNNKSSAKRGIIRPWQVKRCSTKTGSAV